VRFDPAATDTIDLELDQIIMPLPALPESRYRKHIVFESPSLSKFWGRPVQLGALLLLPEGWYDHPKARYPLAIYHSHFGRDLTGWRETRPTRDCRRSTSRRCAASAPTATAPAAPRPATNGCSRRRPTGSTRPGPAPASRACCCSRSSTPIRITTIRMR
jgi:hypothetical protein